MREWREKKIKKKKHRSEQKQQEWRVFCTTSKGILIKVLKNLKHRTDHRVVVFFFLVSYLHSPCSRFLSDDADSSHWWWWCALQLGESMHTQVESVSTQWKLRHEKEHAKNEALYAGERAKEPLKMCLDILLALHTAHTKKKQQNQNQIFTRAMNMCAKTVAELSAAECG